MSNTFLAEVLGRGGVKTLVERIQGMIKDEIDKIDSFSIIEVSSSAELPNIGSSNALYIMSTEVGDTLYKWDPNNLSYVIIGSNYMNIKIIRGGTANG